MMGSKPIHSPMGTNSKLGVDEADSLLNQTIYRGIIDSLLYFTATRPNIVFSVEMCATFQACPEDSYLKASKRLLRYLK